MMTTSLFLLALGLSAVGTMASLDRGCYNQTTTECDCASTKDDCTALAGLWTENCDCAMSEGCYGAEDKHTCDCDSSEAACDATTYGTWTDGCACDGKDATKDDVTVLLLEGCYISGECNCGGSEEACLEAEGQWSSQCMCTSTLIDIDCPWNWSPYYGICSEGFPRAVNAVAGDYLEMAVSTANVVMLEDKAAFEACTLDNPDVLQETLAKTVLVFRYTFNQPGIYYLTTSTSDFCEQGQKVMIIVEGEGSAENKQVVSRLLAPVETSQPGPYDPWMAFGKGVYHDRAYERDLHTPCTGPLCVDTSESTGSCYFAGTDFHIGHAVFCDVTETACCGYEGCSDEENKSYYENSMEKHNYYWYAPGYMGRSKCCHCMASCDHSQETKEDGKCAYYDVTEPNCQREEDPESFDGKTVGFLTCEAPAALTLADAIIRHTPTSAPTTSAPTISTPLPTVAPGTNGTTSTTAKIPIVQASAASRQELGARWISAVLLLSGMSLIA